MTAFHSGAQREAGWVVGPVASAVYQAATSWVGRRPVFERRENSLLFRSMKCNIQTVGKYFGWGQGQRRADIHRSILRGGSFIPNTHGVQSKGHTSSLFSFFSFHLKGVLGTVPYFCLVRRKKYFLSSDSRRIWLPLAVV